VSPPANRAAVHAPTGAGIEPVAMRFVDAVRPMTLFMRAFSASS
jgi:hypothetical protein